MASSQPVMNSRLDDEKPAGLPVYVATASGGPPASMIADMRAAMSAIASSHVAST